MRIRLSHQKKRQSGVQLIECLVYIAIFFTVADLAYGALYRCWDASAAFRREADEITQSLRAGERWRADIRSATGPVDETTDGATQTVRIPEGQGEVVYTSSNGQVRRLAPNDSREAVALSHVKLSQMKNEAGAGAPIWRWELELTSTRKGKMRPLFSFAAVAPQGGSHAH